jgi:hypothetical protein
MPIRFPDRQEGMLMLRSLSSFFALALLAAVLSVPTSAEASWFEPHTIQEDVPFQEIHRSLVTGKSHMTFDLDFRFKQSTSHFIGSGLANVGLIEGEHWEAEKNDGRWTYRRWELGLAWGFSRNFDLYARIPVIWASVFNNRMMDENGNEAPISAVGLGDVVTGFRFQFLRNQSDDGKFSNSLIGTFEMKTPTGNESPGTYLPGPNNLVTIITGTGTWGFDFGARFKQQLAIVAIEVGAGFTWNPTGTVMYLVEDRENYFNQHLDPGDVIHFDVGVTVQLFRHLALRGDLELAYRTPTRWGSTEAQIPACGECDEIPNSEGLWVDVSARVISDFDEHFGLDAYFSYTLGGRRNFLWPLEDISPSRGFTVGGNLSYRY